MTKKAELAQARLHFIVNALGALLRERMFVTLLRAERLDKLPLPILRRIPHGKAQCSGRYATLLALHVRWLIENRRLASD
jgi:hypothetical protein